MCHFSSSPSETDHIHDGVPQGGITQCHGSHVSFVKVHMMKPANRYFSEHAPFVKQHMAVPGLRV